MKEERIRRLDERELTDVENNVLFVHKKAVWKPMYRPIRLN